MTDNKENIEFIDEQQERKELKFGAVKDLLDGRVLTKDIVVRQIPFIIFLTILAFFYIGNRYHAEKVVRESIVLQKELKDLRAQAITIASELMFISKQSEVSKLVKKHGLELEETLEPPKKIIIKVNK
ncbi:MAG: FtsL-like putative cell division protein [Bacteroidota bacterium]|nr:FtsL-like putative cell division protein [Bacteroidota bacterium]